MARIRSTHPGQWRDEDFVELSFGARLLALALRNEADDQGLFEWKPKQIKMNCFPADSVDIDALLSEIVAANIVKAYEVEGHRYGAIRNFRLYQRPKTPNALYPLTPEIREYVALDGRKGGRLYPSTHAISEIEDDKENTISETIPKSDQQVEGVGGRRKEEGDSHKTAGAAVCVDFDRWSKVFPKKTEQKAAQTAFIEALKKINVDGLIRAAQDYAASVKGKDLRYVKGPAAWLIEERWTDDLSKPSERKAAPVEPHPSWNGKQAALVAKIGDVKFDAWFAPTKLDLGPPVVIEVAGQFAKREIEKQFSVPLRALFGSVEIAVVRDASA